MCNMVTQFCHISPIPLSEAYFSPAHSPLDETAANTSDLGHARTIACHFRLCRLHTILLLPSHGHQRDLGKADGNVERRWHWRCGFVREQRYLCPLRVLLVVVVVAAAATAATRAAESGVDGPAVSDKSRQKTTGGLKQRTPDTSLRFQATTSRHFSDYLDIGGGLSPPVTITRDAFHHCKC